jgi:hypothetical protein
MLTWLNTTVHLNAGSYHLIAGRFDKAVAHFSAAIRRDEATAALQVAAKSCPRTFVEHTAAVMELKRQRVPLAPSEPPDETSPAVPAHEAAGQSGAGHAASP